MGHGYKSMTKRRPYRTSFSVSEEESKTIRRYAREHLMNVSDYVRMRVLEDPIDKED